MCRAMSDIVWFIRLPVFFFATAVGMGHNSCRWHAGHCEKPIADPYILGISSGASLGATVAIFLGVGAVFGILTLLNLRIRSLQFIL